jgi:hypothetical protein
MRSVRALQQLLEIETCRPVTHAATVPLARLEPQASGGQAQDHP